MEALGISFSSLLAQIINFGLLLIILDWLLYKPVVKILEDRRQKIAKGLEDAQKASNTLNKAQEKAKQITDDAYKQSQMIINNAKEEAKKEANEIILINNKKSENILNNAQNEALNLKKQALNDAKMEIANLLVLSMDKIVNQELTDKQKKSLANKTIKEI